MLSALHSSASLQAVWAAYKAPGAPWQALGHTAIPDAEQAPLWPVPVGPEVPIHGQVVNVGSESGAATGVIVMPGTAGAMVALCARAPHGLMLSDAQLRQLEQFAGAAVALAHVVPEHEHPIQPWLELHTMSERLTQAESAAEICKVVIEGVARAFQAPVAGFRLVDGGGQWLVLESAVGYPQAAVGSDRITLEVAHGRYGVPPKIARCVLLTVDSKNEWTRLGQQTAALGVRSSISAPIVADGRLMGTMFVAVNEDGSYFGQSAMTWLGSIADIASLALSRVELRGSARERAQEVERLTERDMEVRGEIEQVRLASIRLLCEALALRDPHIGEHTRRTAALAVALGHVLSLSKEQIDYLYLGALLHDVGKLALPDSVLQGQRALGTGERLTMQSHPEVGFDLAAQLPFVPRESLEVVRHHHERFDGFGYPDALVGEQIALLARVLAVADAFDAMTHDRPYKPAVAVEVALTELHQGAGSQFDPTVVALFGEHALRILNEAADLTTDAETRTKLPDTAGHLHLPSAMLGEPADLLGVASTLLQSTDLASIFDHILSALQSLFGVVVCAILMVDDATGHLRFQQTRGLHPSPGVLNLTIGQGIVGHVQQTAEPYYAPDVTVDPYYVAPAGGESDTRSEAAFPLVADGRVIGVLDVESPQPDAFGAPVRVVLGAFAALTALAIQRAWREQELETYAHTDGLTGLANRRAFWASLERAMRQSQETGQPLSLVVVEIDRFKQVNDRLGHLRGDAALGSVALVLKSVLGGMDVAGRTGGDEFALLLPLVGMAEAVAVAERLRWHILGIQMAHDHRLSASLGVATYVPGRDSADSLFDRADRAMYRAKRQGGNAAVKAREGPRHGRTGQTGETP